MTSYLGKVNHATLTRVGETDHAREDDLCAVVPREHICVPGVREADERVVE